MRSSGALLLIVALAQARVAAAQPVSEIERIRRMTKEQVWLVHT